MLGEAKGRRAGELRKLAEDPRLFQFWDTNMRYAPSSDVRNEWISAWQEAAEKLLHKMRMT